MENYTKRRTLINGIYGKYELKYDEDKKLVKVLVENGNNNVDPRISFENVIQDIADYYGAPVEVEDMYDEAHARFEVGEYVILVTKSLNDDIHTEILPKNLE